MDHRIQSDVRLTAAACCLVACGAAAVMLVGCGAEVAGSAATAATLQAQQAKQAQEQQAKIVDGIKKGQDAAAARAASATE